MRLPNLEFIYVSMNNWKKPKLDSGGGGEDIAYPREDSKNCRMQKVEHWTVSREHPGVKNAFP